MDSQKRVIKKYPNRRLYDTELSRYVTLDDIKSLVLQQVPFEVLDTRTQENLTNIVLLQIISELEQNGAPIFTTEILQQMIRFYGHDMQAIFSDFLSKSMTLAKQTPGANIFEDISTQQMQLWKNWLGSLQNFGK